MSERRWVALSFGVILLILMGFGCSGGDPAQPGTSGLSGYDVPQMRAADNAPRKLLGLWTMIYDAEAHTLTPMPIRTGNLHINVRDILEHPGPLIDLGIENLNDTTMPVVTVDIVLHHPFGGLVEFTGFDVRGLFISRGNWSGWDDATIRLPRASEPRLTNADGYTRWWNPTEFSDGIDWFNYTDGLLGCPHWWANFNSILNGYKLFADGLATNASLDDLNTTNRAVFSAGATNKRHYRIDFGKNMANWVIFNYAVDASWDMPIGSPPWVFPDDYPISNNAPEAYRIRLTETNNTLDFDGYTGTGALGLDIDVFDWQNPGEASAIQVEALELWGGPRYAWVVPGSGGPTYSTYHVDINNCSPTHAGKTDVLISVPCYEWDYQPGQTQWSGSSLYGAYQLYQATIAGSNCPPYAKVDNDGWRVDTAPGNNAATNRNSIWSNGTDVYVVWVDSSAGNQDIFFNKSADGGQTWLPNQVRLTDDIANNYIQKLPQIAVSPNGQRICVIWDDQRYASPAEPIQDIDEPMYAISADGGTSWTANMSAKMGGIGNEKQFQPTICSDDQGAFYMAWIDEDVGGPGDKTAYFAKITSAATTVSLNTIVGDKIGNNYFGAQDWKLDIEYDNNTDTIYVIWADPRNDFTGSNTAVDVFIDRSTDGGTTWGTDVKVNPDNTNTDQYNPGLVIGDSGILYAVYIDEKSGTAELAFVKSLSGGNSFSNYQLIDSLVGAHWYPDMARGGLENLFVVWQMTDTSYISWSCDEGETWVDPVLIDPVETPDQVNSPTVDVGDNQHVFVAASWRQDAGQPRYIRCWRWQ